MFTTTPPLPCISQECENPDFGYFAKADSSLLETPVDSIGHATCSSRSVEVKTSPVASANLRHWLLEELGKRRLQKMSL